jgi:hypothetical protein
MRRGRPISFFAITAAIVALVLTGCATSSQNSTGSDSPGAQDAGSSSTSATVEAVPKVCPQKVISFVEGLYGPSQSQDLSAIDVSLEVTLPAGADCVLTVAGDTANSTAYYIYWSNQGAAFATSIAQTMVAAGHATDNGPLGSTEKSGADSYVYAYPADGTFGSADYVWFWGQFDGAPGS